MKRLLIATLSTLTFAATVPVYAQQVTTMNQNTNQTMTRKIVEVTPFNLVQHGYQGYFTEQGIPSGAAFLGAVRRGRVGAEDLVKGGIARGRLTPETLKNQSYLHYVRVQLEGLKRAN
jgi:hypothetical protein